MAHGDGDGGDASTGKASAAATSPNGEALLRARLLKIELPSASTSYTSDSSVAGAHEGGPSSYLFSSGLYCEGRSPKSTPSTPIYDVGVSTTSGSSHYDSAGVGKLNSSFGSSGIASSGRGSRGERGEKELCHYSYLHSRKMQYNQCTQECTRIFTVGDERGTERVAGGVATQGNALFVSGDAVARNREILSAHGITHVINCCGYVSKNYFEQRDDGPDSRAHARDDALRAVEGAGIEYMTLWLEDSPTEDIVTVLYKVFDFISDALYERGAAAPSSSSPCAASDSRCSTGRRNVLIHCTQGVSRSISLCIAYMMHRTRDFDYERTFRRVKDLRSIANPNIGFVCQLLQWGKRLAGITSARAAAAIPSANDSGAGVADVSGGGNGYESLRIFRMAPHSRHDPSNLVAKIVHQPSSRPSTSQSSNASHGSAPPGFDPQVFDSRFAFVVHMNTGSDGEEAAHFVWVGSRCNESLRRGAVTAAASFERYEWYCPHVMVMEGDEPARLRSLLEGSASTDTTTSISARLANSENSAYDDDFDLVLKCFSNTHANRTRQPRTRLLEAKVADGDHGGGGGGGGGDNGNGSDDDAGAPDSAESDDMAMPFTPPLARTLSC